MSFVIGLPESIAANLIFWLLLGGFFWGISKATSRKFFSFFGLSKISSFSFYLSNLWTSPAKPGSRTVGYSIALHELRAAQSVENLFGAAPLRLPELVRGLEPVRSIMCR
jgi:hypothetical protein